jgi:triosephosphate isomerase
VKYVIGNWKANKTVNEAREWMEIFANLFKSSDSTKVVLCPSFPHLPVLNKLIKKTNIQLELGAQNISRFSQGSYTGEVSASQISLFVKYVLIGHSERRKYFRETDEILTNKVQQAQKNNIEVIYCVRSDTEFIPLNIKIVAYEPIEAIGSGKPADPAIANAVIQKIKSSCPFIKTGIYGGSINSKNVTAFLKQPQINGVLPGRASLDAVEFSKIIDYASKV